MEATPADNELAEKTCVILAERGRVDLSVSAVQIAKWRSEADALPVVSDRRPGRGHSTIYAADAAEVAASLAIALADDRNLDRAILAAFATGAPVQEKGLRSAARHYLRDFANKAHEGYADRYTSRTAMRRAMLSVFRASLHTDIGRITDALLSLALGKRPDAGRGATTLVFDAIFTSACADSGVMESKVHRRASFIMTRGSSSMLNQLANRIEVGRWREGCQQVHVLLEYSLLHAELVKRTGTSIADLPQPFGVLDAMVASLWSLPSFKRSSETYVALMGLVVAGLTLNRHYAQAMVGFTNRCLKEIPCLEMLISFANDVPPQWLGSLSPVEGRTMAFIDELSASEREEFHAYAYEWRDRHTEWSTTIGR